MRGVAGDVAAGMARVVIAAAFGGPEVLAVTGEPVPDPGPGEARIEVRAAGVNPVDYKVYSGAYGADPARLPIRPGAEAAGVVTAVGADAAGPAGPLAVGDEVIAFRSPGAYASELVVPGQALVPKPAALGWAQAAGLMLAGVTAWHALAATDVHKGDTVLIHGAAGGVGIMAVQLAAPRGADVVAAASPAGTSSCAGSGHRRWLMDPGWLTGSVPRRRPGSARRSTWLAPTRRSTSHSRSSPIVGGSPRSRASHAGWQRGSRFSVARRARTLALSSATQPGWNWPGSPRRGRCGCL